MPVSEIWDSKSWQTPPSCHWIKPAARQQVGQVLYENEPYHGEATQVFARIGLPDAAFDPGAADRGGVPAMVCLHGGGGKSYEEWVQQWMARGYAAISMDLAGYGENADQRLANGGPGQSHQQKFFDMRDHPPTELWSYHAAAAAVRAVSLMASLDGVDADRIGLTGVSWGGYLACLVAGLDPRLKFVAPVYGCGYITEKSVWRTGGAGGAENPMAIDLDETLWQQWDRHFDPRHFLPHTNATMLFVTGTNDFAYPLESWQKSSDLPTGRVQRAVRVEMAHSHPPAWAAIETAIAADHILRNGPNLVDVELTDRQDHKVQATIRIPPNVEISYATLHLSDEAKHWTCRTWRSIPANMQNDRLTATLPEDAPDTALWFINATDNRGAVASSSIQQVGQAL